MLYSHSFLVIAQVQWGVSLSVEILKVLQNLKGNFLTFGTAVGLEPISLVLETSILPIELSPCVQPLRGKQRHLVLMY